MTSEEKERRMRDRTKQIQTSSRIDQYEKKEREKKKSSE